MINANALGTEILKSLILPGIGAFTIVDGEKVTEEDIGSKYDLLLVLAMHLKIYCTFCTAKF